MSASVRHSVLGALPAAATLEPHSLARKPEALHGPPSRQAADALAARAGLVACIQLDAPAAAQPGVQRR